MVISFYFTWWMVNVKKAEISLHPLYPPSPFYFCLVVIRKSLALIHSFITHSLSCKAKFTFALRRKAQPHSRHQCHWASVAALKCTVDHNITASAGRQRLGATSELLPDPLVVWMQSDLNPKPRATNVWAQCLRKGKVAAVSTSSLFARRPRRCLQVISGASPV